MAYVFVSYAHHDADFVLKELKPELHRQGINIWIDDDGLNAGMNWREGIDQAIRTASVALVVVTPSAMQSHFVTYEWACAWGADIPLIPVLLEESEMHPRLETIQYIDFSRFHDWDRLHARVRSILSPNKLAADESEKTNSESLQPTDELVDRLLRQAVNDSDVNATKPLIKMDRSIYEPLLAKMLEDREMQYAAAEIFHKRQSEAKLFLLRALQSKDNLRRIASIRALSIMQEVDTIPRMMKIAGEDNAIRLEAYNQIVEHIGGAGIPVLSAQLKDPHEQIRHDAAWLLGEIGDVRALPPLFAALYDNSESVRMTVADALGNLGGPNDIQKLLSVLNDHNDGIVYAAVLALSKMNGRLMENKEARPATVASIMQQTGQAIANILADTNRSVELRAQSLAVLGTLKARPVIRICAQILSDPQEDDWLKTNAIKVLGDMRDASVLDQLYVVLESDHNEQVNEALMAIGKIGGKDVLPTLIEHLSHPAPNHRVAAIEGMQYLQDIEAIPYLEKHLQDHYKTSFGTSVADVAAKAIIAIQSPD